MDLDSRRPIRGVYGDPCAVGKLDHKVKDLFGLLLGDKSGDQRLDSLTDTCIECFFSELKPEYSNTAGVAALRSSSTYS
jgi:hypothetical protein